MFMEDAVPSNPFGMLLEPPLGQHPRDTKRTLMVGNDCFSMDIYEDVWTCLDMYVQLYHPPFLFFSAVFLFHQHRMDSSPIVKPNQTPLFSSEILVGVKNAVLNNKTMLTKPCFIVIGTITGNSPDQTSS
jgi:hypothetical protein